MGRVVRAFLKVCSKPKNFSIEGVTALWNGLNHALNDLSLLKLRMLVINLLNRLKDFTYSLQILGFAWVFSLQVGHNFLNVHDNNTKMLLIR